MKDNVTIHAVMDDGVPMMFEALIDKGVDVSKCFICKGLIIRTERAPRYLDERLKRWWAKVRGKEVERYYDWNIGAFYHLGIICEEMSCFTALLDINRMDDMLKMLMETLVKTRSEAIEWMKELGHDVSRLREE